MFALTASAALAFAPSLSPVQPTASPRAACITCAASEYLDDIVMGPPDAILGIAANFRASTAPNKVNLAVGAYRDDGGSPPEGGAQEGLAGLIAAHTAASRPAGLRGAAWRRRRT